MATEEKIKASVRKALDDEAGLPLGFTEARTMIGQAIYVTPPPLTLAVYADGTVSVARRTADRYMPGDLDLRRADLSEAERLRLTEQWDAALVQAAHLKRADVAIVAHAASAHVELRTGPDFDPPKGGA